MKKKSLYDKTEHVIECIVGFMVVIMSINMITILLPVLFEFSWPDIVLEITLKSIALFSILLIIVGVLWALIVGPILSKKGK